MKLGASVAVPVVERLAINGDPVPADEDPAMVVEVTAKRLGDREVSAGIMDLQKGLEGVVPALAAGMVIVVHVAADEFSGLQDIEVLLFGVVLDLISGAPGRSTGGTSERCQKREGMDFEEAGHGNANTGCFSENHNDFHFPGTTFLSTGKGAAG